MISMARYLQMATNTRSLLLIVLMVQAVIVTIYLGIGHQAITARIFSIEHNEAQVTTCQNGSSLTFSSFKDNDTSKAIKESWTLDRLPPSKSDVFQPIDNTSAWVYSAFYDHVAAQDGRPLVQVIGIVFKNTPSEMFCSFISDGRKLISAGNISRLPDTHDSKGTPFYMKCSLSINKRPTHVSLSFSADTIPTNLLQIQYPGPRIRNFTVCYSILHSGFNLPTQMIESIEMNMMLGAEHFMIYNYSISPDVDQILRRYQKDGLVTVFQWPLPTGESWYFAQMAALNDCFYRNRNTSRFVVVVDTDELIVPANHFTWKDLIQNVSAEEPDISQFTNSSEPRSKDHNLTSCFLVRSSQFYRNSKTDWNLLPTQFPFSEEEKQNIVKYNILSLSQFWREENIWLHEVRSKYIARPEHVHICGMHIVWEFTFPSSCLLIQVNESLVHHYRVYNPSKNVANTTYMLKFKDTLYPRVMKQIKLFPNIFP